MLDDAWCVWSCLGFWWILRFCHGGFWCDENVWRRCLQLFRDGWSCFKTFKVPKRRLKMAENVKSCLRIIQDGLWCFQRYLKMLLRVAWKMVKDSWRSLKSIMSHSPSQGTTKNTIILTLRFTPSKHLNKLRWVSHLKHWGKIPPLLPWKSTFGTQKKWSFGSDDFFRISNRWKISASRFR